MIDKKNNKTRIIRVISFVLAVFFIALNYNLILTPNKIVIGGASGLALAINGLTGFSRIKFLYIVTGVLFIVSLIFLDKKSTFKSLFGSLTFNIMVNLTSNITNVIDLNIEGMFLILLISSLINGVSTGIIYRSGYNTGGADIIITILNKYLKIPMGKSSTITNIFIIGCGFLVFGPVNTLYALFILVLGNSVIDLILLGLKDYKMCFVKSDKEIKDYILKNLNLGITEISSQGGFLKKKKPLYLVILPREKYNKFKNTLSKIDDKIFIMTINCYGAAGGFKKNIFPF